MTEQEFIEKMRKLAPFFNSDTMELETLYWAFETVVNEFCRLEKIEDDTVELWDMIQTLKKENVELKNAARKGEKYIEN